MKTQLKSKRKFLKTKNTNTRYFKKTFTENKV